MRRAAQSARTRCHKFFTRDGTSPAELLRIAREQLAVYDVAIRDAGATGVLRVGDDYAIESTVRLCGPVVMSNGDVIPRAAIFTS
jgi:hypothetical protein